MIEGCTFVCGIMAILCGVLSWYSLSTGDTAAMVLVFAFAICEMLISGFVLVMRYAN
jgi:hypothetical protein